MKREKQYLHANRDLRTACSAYNLNNNEFCYVNNIEPRLPLKR